MHMMMMSMLRDAITCKQISQLQITQDEGPFNNQMQKKVLRKERAILQVFTAFAAKLEGWQTSGEEQLICCRKKLLSLLEQGGE